MARVLDAEVEDAEAFVVTELVEGPTLEEDVAADGPFTPAELSHLAHGLAEALRAIHAVGVVHRDFKPGNVMMSEHGPVVIDFGIAQVADDARLTQTGMVTGTPGYLDPEVIAGAEPIAHLRLVGVGRRPALRRHRPAAVRARTHRRRARPGDHRAGGHRGTASRSSPGRCAPRSTPSRSAGSARTACSRCSTGSGATTSSPRCSRSAPPGRWRPGRGAAAGGRRRRRRAGPDGGEGARALDGGPATAPFTDGTRAAAPGCRRAWPRPARRRRCPRCDGGAARDRPDGGDAGGRDGGAAGGGGRAPRRGRRRHRRAARRLGRRRRHRRDGSGRHDGRPEPGMTAMPTADDPRPRGPGGPATRRWRRRRPARCPPTRPPGRCPSSPPPRRCPPTRRSCRRRTRPGGRRAR